MWFKTEHNNKIMITVLLSLLILAFFIIQNAEAAVNNDYCVTPPYIGSAIEPNLLLMIDNSSSMYDLQYVDKGSATRVPYYCYDETYQSTNTYTGYFDKDKLYQYDATNKDFYEIVTFPADASCATSVKKIISPVNTLFICYTTTSPVDVTTFVAKGNYLNWLTASKFDEQKQILTGGKHVTKICSNAADTSCVAASDCPSGGTCDTVTNAFLQTESRGCVGKGFVKEALDADYVEGGVNTSLGITFSIKGPIDTTNPTAPSPGGQTSIEVYLGNYNQSLCQDAIDTLSDSSSSNADIKKAVDDCLSYTTASGSYCKLDPLKTLISSCSKDSDCNLGGGVCSIVSDGVCGLAGGGVCSPNNGTCPSGKKCVGGTNNGASCSNIGDCPGATACSKVCSGGGKAGQVCSSDSSCTAGICTAGRTGNLCSVNADCNPSACTAPAGKVGLSCTTNASCNSSACSGGLHAGSSCAVNSDCDSNYGPCVSPTSTTESKTKVVFNQSMQACWAYRKGTDIGNDEVNTVHNQCSDLYDENKICLGGDNHGKICTSIADCPGTDAACVNGPDAVQPGNPSYLCSRSYAGFCAASSDLWVTTSWIANGYASADECVKQKHREFCNFMDASPVVDPTDAPSETTNYDNLPAIISDIGVEAQLGQPLKSLKARVRKTTAPTSLVQEFEDQIRMGVMTFNFNGSVAECSTASLLPAGTIPCPKVCSTDTTKTCGSPFDCPSPGTATCAFATNNLDGAKIVYYIGTGKCSVSTSTVCVTDDQCTPLSPAGQTCISDGVGDHTTGLVRTIDDIRGSTWTPFSEGFFNAVGYFGRMSDGTSNTNLRINATDYDANKNPSQMVCQKNNVLLISDGMSTADLNADVGTFASLYTSGSPTLYGPLTGAACTSGSLPYGGSKNLDNIAWAAKNRNISALLKTTATTSVPSKSNESISTYVVLSGADNGLSGECSSKTLLENTAKNGGTNLYTAETPTLLKAAIEEAFETIAAKAASGTAASVLASGEGSGANLIQAVFYPLRKFTNTAAGVDDEVAWTGRLSNLWYYVDPQFSTSNIREDDGDSILNLKTDASSEDYIVSLYFDKATEKTKVHRWTDPAGNGVVGTQLADIEFEQIGNLWEAGTMLWQRDVTTAAGKRKIYTTIDGKNFLAGNFSKDTLNGDSNNAATLRPYLQAATDTEGANIINWVQGVDVAGYRSRTVKVESIDTTPRVWKLGDIVNSTPKISSWMSLNIYNKVYNDETYGILNADANLGDPANNSHFVTTAAYKARGMVFTGGNDGMLHAFKLGTLKLRWTGQGSTQMAKLVNPDTGLECTDSDTNPCGKEMWAFIPKNALPYLRYMAEAGYCHLYSIDLTPFVFDASINGLPDAARTVSSWKTILIGGMRFGGACKNFTDTCTNCVKTPTTDPADATKGLGYSSYFALDVTDQNNPTLLWEFSDPALGFATTGPAMVRINGTDKSKNGNWFVVFGSGPTGPISTGDHQFLGTSDQNLKLFILNLAKPVADDWTLNTNYWVKDTGISNAFAGSLVNGALDADTPPEDYQDEVVYVPYTNKCTSDTAAPSPFSSTNICINNTWTNGGVGRLSTKRDSNPANWVWSTLIENIGPVSAAATKLLDPFNNNLWVYFGTGRYYYSQSGGSDDGDGKRFLFGIKDPCFTSSGYNNTCTTSATLASSPFGGLTDVTDISNVPSTNTANASTFKGWYLGIDGSGSYTYAPDIATNFSAERVITDPLASMGKGILYFTSYKPYTDQCVLGGKSFIWALQYNTGGPPISTLKGKVLVQVSTGAIEQKDLSTAFTDAGGRKSGAMEGKPPEAQGMSVLSQPKPVKKIIHMRER